MDTHSIIAKLITSLLAILDATNLRNRVYTLEQRVITLELALEDIERISASRVAVSERHKLIKGIVENTRRIQ